MRGTETYLGLTEDAMNLRRQTATVEAPRSMVGRVIGKNGETIKALQNYTGALIQIDQSTEPTRVTVSGTPHCLSLAVAMVSDIIKGNFKGFALLRQLAKPISRVGPNQLAQPKPVYAPGYGLIPPSQLYGGDDRVVLPFGRPVRDQQQLPVGYAWASGQVTPSQVILGLQPTRPVLQGQPGNMPVIGGHVPQVVHQVYGTLPMSMQTSFGSQLAYYPQDFSQGGAIQPGETLVYQQEPVVYPHATAAMAASNGAKVLQTALGTKPPSHHLLKVSGNESVNDLLGNSNTSVSGGGPSSSNSLVQVVDRDGKVFYYETVDS